MQEKENSYTAPLDSENYNKLISIVREHSEGGSELANSLRETLWLLNVPGHLNFLGWMTEKLDRFLRHRERLEGAFSRFNTSVCLDFSFLDQLSEWIDWYKLNKEIICNQLGDDFEFGPPETEKSKDSKPKNPFSKKGMSRYGLYAALVCIQEVERDEVRQQWELLALRLILSHQKSYRSWSLEGYEQYEGMFEWQNLDRKMYAPTKDLRKLSYKEFEEFLLSLSDKDLVGSEYKLSSKDNKAAGYLGGLLRHMDLTERNAGRRRRQTGYIRTDSAGRKHLLGQGYVEFDKRRAALHGEFVDIDDPWVNEPPLEVVEIFTHVEGLDPKEIADIELYPLEIGDGDQLTLVGQDCNKVEKNAGTAAIAARARNKHLATQAQMFRWRYATLTYEQFKFVNEALRSEFPSLLKIKRSQKEEERLEVALILLVMLWTGSDLDRALSLSEHRDNAETTTAQLSFHDLGRESVGNRYEWQFQSLRPEYFSNPQFNTALTRPRKSSFWLPDLSRLVCSLELYRNNVQTNKRPNRLFLREREKYECLIKKYMSEFNQSTCGEGITLKKISDFLFHQIVGETADVTVAAFITAKAHHFVNTSIFYTTPTLDYLRSVYEKACQPLLELCGYPQPSKIAKTKDEEVSVGARHCVKVSAYLKAIQKIQADLKEAAYYSNWQEFVSFHNLFTFYSILMFGFASAARAIKSPLLKGSEVDANGFSTFTDKDTTRPYHSRLIWLPDMVRLQLVEYERHKDVTTNWLKLKWPSKTYVEQVLPCYFIAGDKFNHMQVVMPSTLKKFYNHYLQVPVNAHRRMLRTELLEGRMPVEALDCFMGHWALGQEPWSQYSTFNIPEYVSNLQHYLVPLMDELGFEFMKSPLVEA